MDRVKDLANLIKVLEDIEGSRDIEVVVRVPELTEGDFHIAHVVKEYGLMRNFLGKDKIVLICK